MKKTTLCLAMILAAGACDVPPEGVTPAAAVPPASDRIALLGGVGNPNAVETSTHSLTEHAAVTNIDSWPASGCPLHVPPGVWIDQFNNDQSVAQEAVNKVRRKIGFSCLKAPDGASMKSALQHSRYSQENFGVGSCQGANPHREVPGCPYYTGVNFSERMTAYGYTAHPSYEVMAYDGSISDMVAQWLESAFHALPLLDSRIEHAGFGLKYVVDIQHGNRETGTIDFGRTNEWPTRAWVDYPIDGQTNVPRSWGGYENPSPPAPPAGWPSGPMFKHIEPGFFMTGISIIDINGNGIPFQWMGPGHSPSFPLEDGEYFVYPNSPLAANSWYAVVWYGVKNGVNVARGTAITTGAN